MSESNVKYTEGEALDFHSHGRPGKLGALAAKPVMEGKAVLFKRFADVDAIDIEVKTEDAQRFIDCVELLEPSFGGINLDQWKSAHAVETDAKTLAEALVGADVFLGLSAANVLSTEMVETMAKEP